MSFDRIAGERLEGLGDRFRVVPNRKWRETPLFSNAAHNAAKAFMDEGALWPVLFDDEEFIVQEYPSDHKVAFVFEKRIRNKLRYFVWVWDIPDEGIRELKADGKWDDLPSN
jgi:hypothetical protein